MTLPSKVNDQPAYCLHRINYGESSYILDCLTRDYGRVSLMVKGGKKRKNQSCFQLFQALTINFSGKSEMKTLTGIDGKPFFLGAKASIAAMYVNELLINLIPKQHECEEVFTCYEALLAQLTDSFMEQPLRHFEFQLLDYLGVLPDFSQDCLSSEDICDDLKYQFHPQQGFYLAQNGDGYLGQHIRAIGQQYYDKVVLQTAKKIMRHSIQWQLNGRVLKTRALFKQLYSK